MNREQLIKSLIIMLMVIIGSVMLIRSFTNGQTLSEYAEKNNIPVHSEQTDDK